MNTDGLISEMIRSYLAGVAAVLDELPTDKLWAAVQRLAEAQRHQRAVFTCGNGGSAATATHFASDLAKGTRTPDKPCIRAVSLCDNVSLMTAWANDESFDEVFAQQSLPWIQAGDVLVAISASGNSRNVLRAVSLAAALGAATIGLTGFDGGELKHMVDICVTVPTNCMEQVEDVHLVICHLIATCLRNLPPDEVVSSHTDYAPGWTHTC